MKNNDIDDKKVFIPSIQVNDDSNEHSNTSADNEVINLTSIVSPDDTTPKPTLKPRKHVRQHPDMSKRVGGLVTSSSAADRRVANISEMVKPVDPNAPVPGIDKRISPEDDVLKANGPFEKYRREKRAEIAELQRKFNASKEAAEKAAAEKALDKSLGITNRKEIENNIPEADSVSNTGNEPVTQSAETVPPKQTYKRVELSRDDEQPSDNARQIAITEDQINSILSIIDTKKDNMRQEEENIDMNTEQNAYPTDLEPEVLDQIDEDTDMDSMESYTDEIENDNVSDEPISSSEFAEEEIPEENDIDDEEVSSDEESDIEDTELQDDLNDDMELDIDEKEEEERDIHTKKIKKPVKMNEPKKTSNGLPTSEERFKDFTDALTKRLKDTEEKLDITGYTFADKATSSDLIFNITGNEISSAKWCLPSTGIIVEMSAFSGQDIENLRLNATADGIQEVRNRLKIIYNHIVTPKPSFDVWLKSISFADYDHLFMPIFIASFDNSNYMPGTCAIEPNKEPKIDTGCGKIFLTDNIPVMKCVKFTSDDTKKKFWELYDSNISNPRGLYTTELIPISKDYIIKFKEPSLYSVMFETAVLDNTFIDEYIDAVAIFPYVENIYWADHKNKKLVRIAYEEFKDNLSRTVKSKVIKYNKILQKLNTDQYTKIMTIVESINNRESWLTYQIPEMICPECGRKINSEDVSAASLLFTRHRLGRLANTSIK